MVSQIEDISDYQSLIKNGVPLLDVRAPVEYEVGCLPTSFNAPILDNHEREKIGTCYKINGRDKAVKLGHQLVYGANKQQKIDAWRKFYEAHNNAVIYCARGGMRSKLTQEWLSDLGIELPRVHLGYKGLRQYMLTALEEAAQHPILVLSGNTGTGKTDLLQGFAASIDLEGLANHHGSAFGRNITAQPAQATFENALAAVCVQKRDHPIWLLEDESRCIGKNHLPASLYDAMGQAPLVVVNEDLDGRLERISQLYFRHAAQQYRDVYGEEEGWLKYSEYLLKGLNALQKRLGLSRHSVLIKYLQNALSHQEKTGEIDEHLTWLTPLLTEYYDPMYDYQLSKKQARILFQGNYQSAQQFIESYMN